MKRLRVRLYPRARHKHHRERFTDAELGEIVTASRAAIARRFGGSLIRGGRVGEGVAVDLFVVVPHETSDAELRIALVAASLDSADVAGVSDLEG